MIAHWEELELRAADGHWQSSLFRARQSYWYEHGPRCLGNVCDRRIVLPAGPPIGAALENIKTDCARNRRLQPGCFTLAAAAGAAAMAAIFGVHHLKQWCSSWSTQQPERFCGAH